MTPQEAIKHGKEQLDIFGGEHQEFIEMAIKALEQQPKTGHWIEEEVFDGELGYRCSECGELFWLESGTPKDNEYDFCPKCGAKMVESEDKK